MKNILVYAIDGVGYGHIARMANFVNRIADVLDSVNIIFVSGYSNISNFLSKNDKVDYIKLPSFTRIQTDWKSNEELVKQVEVLRSAILGSILTIQYFDYIIIDFFLFGKRDELLTHLKKVRYLYPTTEILLTFRGIAFSKTKSLKFFKGDFGVDYLNNVYDKIICFVDKRIIDINKEYFNEKVVIPIDYWGLIGPSPKEKFEENLDPKRDNRSALNITINFGGGYNCDKILISVLYELIKESNKIINLSIVLGEYFESKTILFVKTRFKEFRNIKIYYLAPHKDIYKIKKDVLIGCGGYNTTVESLMENIPTIIIPKKNDRESSIFCSRIAQYSNIKVIKANQIKYLWETIEAATKNQNQCKLDFLDDKNLDNLIKQTFI